MTHSPSRFHAQLAAEEFARRRAALKQAIGEGRITPDAAERSATLWLAIAAAAGADLPELAVKRVWPRGSTGRRHHSQIADPAAWRAELARYRDLLATRAELHRKDLKAQQRAWDFESLANALGCAETTLTRDQAA